jgi:hypothetical protein
LEIYYFNYFLYFCVDGTKIVVLAILKYGRVKNTCNTLTTSRSKIVAKNTSDFLDYLKSGKFDETLKVKDLKFKQL